MPIQVKKVQLKLKDGQEYKDGDLLFNVDAQAWATGKRNRVDVASTDQTYQNNAAYYAQQAHDSADAAAVAALEGNLATIFDSTESYSIGDYVIYDGTLYRFKVDHAAGAWNAAHVDQKKVDEVLIEFKDQIDDYIVINEDATDNTKIQIETTDEDIDLALSSQLNAVANSVTAVNQQVNNVKQSLETFLQNGKTNPNFNFILGYSTTTQIGQTLDLVETNIGRYFMDPIVRLPLGDYIFTTTNNYRVQILIINSNGVIIATPTNGLVKGEFRYTASQSVYTFITYAAPTDSSSYTKQNVLDNINCVYIPAAVTTDKTLTLTDKAADAKSTGEMIIVNDDSTSGTRINITTSNEDIEIPTMDEVDDLKTQIMQGIIFLYTDLSTWLNAYNDFAGQPISSPKIITPNALPVKLKNGDSLYIDSGTLVCTVSIYEYDSEQDKYTRKSNVDYTGEITVTSNSNNYYYAVSFKGVISGGTMPDITPSDFDGSIWKNTEWHDTINDNTKRLDDMDKNNPDPNGLIYAYTDLTQWTQGYFNANGTITSTSWRITPLSAPIKMTPGDEIVIDPRTLEATIGIYTYNSGTYARQSSFTISTLTTLSYDQTTYIAFDFGKNPGGATSPSDFNGYIKTPCNWRAQINNNTSRIASLENAAASGDILFGKKLVACGDSITAAVNPQGGHFNSYAKLTADRNGMDFDINAVSGSTMTNVAGHDPFCVDRYEAVPDDFDYLTIWFGWNDGEYATVGTISDTVDTTFYGAYKKVLDYFISEYPTKKIGLVVPYMANSDFQDAVREISELYGVPCLDLPNGNECSLIYGTATAAQLARRAALTYDGTHPNQAGHNYLSTMYEAFLRRL